MKITLATIILSLVMGISSYAQVESHHKQPKGDAQGVQKEMPERNSLPEVRSRARK